MGKKFPVFINYKHWAYRKRLESSHFPQAGTYATILGSTVSMKNSCSFKIIVILFGNRVSVGESKLDEGILD